MTLILKRGAFVAFGKNKQPQSYGVPVRAAAPPQQPAPPVYGQQDVAVAAQAWAPAALVPAGFYAPAPAAPQQPYAAVGYAPEPPPPFMRPGWAPPAAPPGFLPPGMIPTKPSAGWRRVLNSKPVAAVIIVLVLAGIGNAARSGGSSNSPITRPTTLGGLPRYDDALIEPQLAAARAQFEQRNHGLTVAVGVYGRPGDGRVIVVAAARSKFNEQQEVGESAGTATALDATSRRAFTQGISCYLTVSGSGVGCFWNGRISALLLVTGISDLDAGAAIAVEAKANLH